MSRKVARGAAKWVDRKRWTNDESCLVPSGHPYEGLINMARMGAYRLEQRWPAAAGDRDLDEAIAIFTSVRDELERAREERAEDLEDWTRRRLGHLRLPPTDAIGAFRIAIGCALAGEGPAGLEDTWRALPPAQRDKLKPALDAALVAAELAAEAKRLADAAIAQTHGDASCTARRDRLAATEAA